MSDTGPTDFPKRYNYEENRALAIDLLGGKCKECGSVEALEIDHIDRATKEFEVSAFLAKHSPQELLEELKKCQLLCHPCHMAKTIRERGDTPAKGTHGTLSSYRYCKCPICTEAHSKYCMEWKARKKAAKKRRAARKRDS